MVENSRDDRVLLQGGQMGKMVVGQIVRALLVLLSLLTLSEERVQSLRIAWTPYLTVVMKLQTAEIREADIEGEEVEEAVIGDGNHEEVAIKEMGDTTQVRLLPETIQQTEDQTTITTHPFIEVGTKEAATKVVETGVEETLVEEIVEVEFRELTAVETPPSPILKAISAWTRQTVEPHPKPLVYREKISTTIITRTRVTDIGKTTTTTGQKLPGDVMIIVEGVVDTLVLAVGRRVRNSLILRHFRLRRLDSQGMLFGPVILLINHAHVLTGTMVVVLKWIGMALVAVEVGAAAISMDNGKEVKLPEVIRHP